MRLALLFSMVLLSLQPTALRAADPFTAGVAEARAGRYAQALEHFLAARAGGDASPQLLFNLGVVYFHLDRLADSRAVFHELAGDPDWAPLARRNLALIESRRQADADAATDRPPAAPAWQGLAWVAAGHDDNVMLANERSVDGVDDLEDQFFEVLAVGRRPLPGPDARLDLGFYYRAHRDLDAYDFGALTAGITVARPLGNWRLTGGLHAELQMADGKRYASVGSVRAQLDRVYGDLAWRLRSDLAFVDAGAEFAYVEGWRSRTQAQASRTLDRGELRLGWELEISDREDLRVDEQFFSFSSWRHGPYAGARLRLTPELDAEARAAMRWSTYRDDNRFLLDGALIEAPRDQDLLSLELRLTYRLSSRWRLWSQFEWGRSDSALTRYDYRGSRYLLGLETDF